MQNLADNQGSCCSVINFWFSFLSASGDQKWQRSVFIFNYSEARSSVQWQPSFLWCLPDVLGTVPIIIRYRGCWQQPVVMATVTQHTIKGTKVGDAVVGPSLHFGGISASQLCHTGKLALYVQESFVGRETVDHDASHTCSLGCFKPEIHLPSQWVVGRPNF